MARLFAGFLKVRMGKKCILIRRQDEYLMTALLDGIPEGFDDFFRSASLVRNVDDMQYFHMG